MNLVIHIVASDLNRLKIEAKSKHEKTNLKSQQIELFEVSLVGLS